MGYAFTALCVFLAACLLALACLSVAHIGCHMNAPWWRAFECVGRAGAVVGAVPLSICLVALILGDSVDLWSTFQGGLLVFAWLVALLSAFVSIRVRRSPRPLDDGAIVVMQTCSLVAVCLVLFADGYLPAVEFGLSFVPILLSVAASASIVPLSYAASSIIVRLSGSDNGEPRV